MMPDEDRERLRRTFNGVAGSYGRIRPDYPRELFDDLIAIARLVRSDHLIEVGPGTGKATLPLARRGFRITGIEPGPDLAAVARRNLAGLDTEIIGERFEEWRTRPGDEAALVYSATAWHWIDPAVRYRRAWEVLHPGGHLAFWSAQHVFPCGGDPFFRDIQEVYDEIGEGLPPGENPEPRPGNLRVEGPEIEASGLFEVAGIRHYDWEQVYDVEDYVSLLGTFSGHIAMEQWQQDRLYGEIRRRLATRPGHSVRRHWGAVLHVGRRLDLRPPGPHRP